MLTNLCITELYISFSKICNTNSAYKTLILFYDFHCNSKGHAEYKCQMINRCCFYKQKSACLGLRSMYNKESEQMLLLSVVAYLN